MKEPYKMLTMDIVQPEDVVFRALSDGSIKSDMVYGIAGCRADEEFSILIEGVGGVSSNNVVLIKSKGQVFVGKKLYEELKKLGV